MTLRYATLYKVNVGDNLGDPSYWNPRLQDIDVRLNAVEGWSATINAAVDAVTTAGIARINDTLQPAINSLSQQVVIAEAAVAALQAQAITDENNTAAQLASLLTTAQGLVAELEALGTIDGGTF